MSAGWIPRWRVAGCPDLLRSLSITRLRRRGWHSAGQILRENTRTASLFSILFRSQSNNSASRWGERVASLVAPLLESVVLLCASLVTAWRSTSPSKYLKTTRIHETRRRVTSGTKDSQASAQTPSARSVPPSRYRVFQGGDQLGEVRNSVVRDVPASRRSCWEVGFGPITGLVSECSNTPHSLVAQCF